jgi:26S proteasome regulatory subunit T3
MGDVLVENPTNHVAPHKKVLPSTIPNIETFEGLPPDGGDEYATLKKLQRQLE